MVRISAIWVAALALAGCNSTERRWAAMCAEEVRDDEVGRLQRSICEKGEYATDAEKREILKMHDLRKAAEARVEATEEEGRRMGYIPRDEK